MKKLSPLFLLAALPFIGLTTACEKDVAPELEVTVLDTLGNPQVGVIVEVSADRTIDGILIEEVLATDFTDRFGKSFLSFPNTVVVDVYSYTVPIPGDTLSDQISVLLETKRKKGNEENVTERTMTLRPQEP